MDVRALKHSDYDAVLSKWWKDWGWTPPPRDMLPEDGSGGVMVSSNGADVCAGFIFFTNSKTAWIEFIVSDKEYKQNDRSDAIDMLIRVLCNIAYEKGFKIIYSSLKNKSLIKKYEKAGFMKGDECIELIKIWQQ